MARLLEIQNKNLLVVLFIIAYFILATTFVYFTIADTFGGDWKSCFYLAAKEILQARSPYGFGYYNPPWIIILLTPLAFISAELSFSVVFVLNIMLFLFVFSKLRIRPVFMIPLIFMSPILVNLLYGNIDGLFALGFILPPQIGLFFLLAKPQIGLGTAIFFAAESYRNGGLRSVFRDFLPVTIAYFFSFLVFGMKMFQGAETLTRWWNMSLFPYTIPLGLFLLWLAIRKRDIGPSMIASLMISPYYALGSSAFMIVGLFASKLFVSKKTNSNEN